MGLLEILSGAGAQNYANRQQAYQAQQTTKQKTLMDLMVQQQRDKKVEELVGQPQTQDYLAPWQQGPQRPGSPTGAQAHLGSGMFGSPDDQRRSQLLLANQNPAAFSKMMADAIGAPARRQQALDEQSLENAGRKDLLTQKQQFALDNPALAPGKAPTSRPHVAKLMANGWMPGARMTKPLLDSIEAAAVYAEENGLPFGVEQARAMEFEGVKNRATGSSAGSRLSIARKQNVNTAFELLDDMEKTGEKLSYSDAKFAGVLEKFARGQVNDPVLTEYMTQRADSLFVLAAALKQNGVTDKSIQVEEEALHPTMSPRALKAWVNTQRRALNRIVKEMNTDYKYGGETVPVYPAGQGGAPTPENPEKGMMDSEHGGVPADIQKLLDQYGGK